MKQENENLLSKIDHRNDRVDDGNGESCGDGDGKGIENYSKLQK